ncbi:adenylate/guanylate cyclase domain-containing protein [Roseobacter sinensis]|uniref:Adenylate/guanylate cyclase domain-containing protein n=1 Tax=Roseobacter sinensis TaxID=2931391 RepID=A0ABT3BEZ8_9RHOB|nr:adenylate/guanylate cyclase domain-containing protein [Roseobacter sp. WL0113]MCV3272120.1 adenylate/guanylate cyclase domain-containing protein [Roseobacter sp. WL0113]
MTDTDTEEFARESAARLKRAEEQGLRLAIACRTLVTGAAFIWYVGTPILFAGFEPRIAAIVVLLIFTAIGITHLSLIGTRHDRWWMKYAVYALDTAAICATFALVPISRADDVPQIIAFRAYGIYYLFPIIAVACLSLSWRLVIWTGAVCVICWWGAFLWVAGGMENILSWSDIPPDATRSDYEEVFLSIDFIGRGNRIEETAMIFFAALSLALAVYRARAVFFAQVASDVQWRRERATRRRVSTLFGKYVPAEIARRLIADDSPLAPQQTVGTTLVMDIAGFTSFSSQRSPTAVIEILDHFFADATRAVSEERGVVITYLGDGFLVTFNAPLGIPDHPTAAMRTAERLHQVAAAHGFKIRIGLATGELVSGTVGSDDRQSFTVYGSSVNLAARLEALSKRLKEPILMDRATADGLEPGWHTAHAGDHALSGFEGPQPVYKLARPPAAPVS